MWGALGGGTRQSLGESEGWYAKETPWGGVGGYWHRRGRLAGLAEAIRAGIRAMVKAASGKNGWS